MTVTMQPYGLFKKSLVNQEVGWLADTIKVSLHTASYTPNLNTHQYKSSLSNEVSGSGYTAGGITLTTVVATYDSGTGLLTVSADPVSWGSALSSWNARYAVMSNVTPATDATRPLMVLIDFGRNQPVVNGTLPINWDPTGIFIF